MNTQRALQVAVLAASDIRSKKHVSPRRSSCVGVCHVWRAWTVVFIPWAVSAVDDPPQATGSLVGQPGQHSLNIYEYICHQ